MAVRKAVLSDSLAIINSARRSARLTRSGGIYMPGQKPCEPGCSCAKHNRPKKARDEQWREHKRQVFRDWYAKNPRSREKTIEQHLSTRHGMRPEDRDAMREEQDGRCCYCERPLPENPRQVHIDHDHSCTCGPKKSCQYCRRGLACEACNTIIGKLGEDWDRLERIAVNGRRLQAEARARINGKPVQAELFDINEAVSRQKRESALWLLAKAWGDCSMSSRTSAGTPATRSASA